MSRMSKERMEKALEQLKTISAEDYEKVKGIANVVRPLRSVIHKTPDDYGMTGWKDLVIPPTTAPRWKPGTSRPRVARATSWSYLTTLCRCVARASPDIWVSRGACMTRSRSTS